jgi:hypothetical protein
VREKAYRTISRDCSGTYGTRDMLRATELSSAIVKKPACILILGHPGHLHGPMTRRSCHFVFVIVQT